MLIFEHFKVRYYRPAVISESAEESSHDALQVWQNGRTVQLAHQLSHAMASSLSAPVIIAAHLSLIVLQNLHTHNIWFSF